MLLAMRAGRGRAPPPGAHRREPRHGIRRRHRAALPAHLQRDGRRREPRGAPDGQGAAPGRSTRRPACWTARPRCSRPSARAVRGQGQEAGRSRRGRSAGRSGAGRARAWRCGSRWSGATRELAACSTRPWPRVGRGAGRLVEVTGEPASARPGSLEELRERPRADAAARDVRGLHSVDALRRLARAPAPAHRRAAGRIRTTSCSSACGRSSGRGTPSCCRGCRCSRSPSTSTCRRRAEVGELAPAFRRARAARRRCGASCATGCAGRR